MTTYRLTNRRVLVIDDDGVTRAMVADYLDAAGFRVDTAECAVYSNHLIYSQEPPDLILMDVMMPMMNGDKKVRLLKRREKSSRIPILLMSTKTEPELRVLTESAGADGYLPKPFSEDGLVRVVSETLMQKAS